MIMLLFIQSEGKPFTVILNKIKGETLHAYWYDPRNGKTTEIGNISNQAKKKFTPPSSGYGQDWVLVLDDASKNYKAALIIVLSLCN